MNAAAHDDVAALVVAADSGALLRACVESLLASPRVATLRLADNASRDGVPQVVASRRRDDARFELHVNARNLGFGAAVNRLARGVSAPWLLVANPDCVVAPAALDALLRVAAAHPRAGLLGVAIVDEAGRVEPASRRRDPLLRRVLASLGLRPGETVAESAGDDAPVLDVEAISGALMLLRRTVFEQLGGFDEGYFLHFEDLDLCRRVRDAGYRVLLAADIRVPHAKGSSSHHRPLFVDWHKHRGMWRWFRKFDPAARNPLLRVLVRCGIWLHFVAVLPRTLWRAAMARSGGD